jgi:predicted small secreted protein
MRPLILVLTLTLLAACNTVEGVKEDATQANQAIQNTAEKLPE